VAGPLRGAPPPGHLRARGDARGGAATSGVSYVHVAHGDVGVLTEVHARGGAPAGESSGAALADLRASCRLESLCHRDCVTALAVANAHDPVLLSASRDGVIKAWR